MLREEFLNKIVRLIDEYEEATKDVLQCEIYFSSDDKTFVNYGNESGNLLELPEPVNDGSDYPG